MTVKWKPSKDQFTDSHCGLWHISPQYWGRCIAVSYELRQGIGYGKLVGTFDTQRAAKARAQILTDYPKL